jgi:hypothetical protein
MHAFNVKFDFNTFYGLHIPKLSFLTQKGAQQKLGLFHFNLYMTKKRIISLAE